MLNLHGGRMYQSSFPTVATGEEGVAAFIEDFDFIQIEIKSTRAYPDQLREQFRFSG